MNTSTVAATTRTPLVRPYEWSHARSHTDPLIKSPERSHKTCLSVDGSIDRSPHRPELERDASTASLSPSKSQKKQKPSSTALTSTSSRKSFSRTGSGLPQSPSMPTFHARPDSRDSKSSLPIPTPDPFPTLPGTPLLRVPSNASTTDSRSPSQRRSPASHSSYGVETSNGPPPSFTTQRTLSQDRLWKPSPSEKSKVLQKVMPGSFYEECEPHLFDTDGMMENGEIDPDEDKPDTTSTPRKGFDERNEAQDLDTDAVAAGHSTETLCNGGEKLTRGLDVPSADEGSKHSGSDDRKSEDLFLNIAHTDPGGQELMTRSERRRSRIGTFYASSVSRLTSGHRKDGTPPAAESPVDDATLSPRTEVPYKPNKRHSFGLRSSAASAHPLDDSGRQRYFSTGTRIPTSSAQSSMGKAERETTPELVYPAGHRATNFDSGARSYRRSNLSAFRSDRNVSSSETPDRPRNAEPNAARVEGTDSTISTTAPSTVWDELDELKSRIKKLELTGKLPSSSAAAMSSAERPQTATTTVTTVSSSPKQRKANTSPAESAISGVALTVHPLLYEALRKARPILSADIYQKLEATASDALQLASVMGTGLHYGNSSAIGASSSAERQLRRRADSMCRGLTELTIALSAGPNPPTLLQPFRPSSRDASFGFGQTPPTTSYSVDSNSRYNRRFSNDPDDARPSVMARVQSRLETRRASLLHNSMINSPPEYASPEIAVHTPSSAHPQDQTPSSSSSRLNRAATRLHSRRAQGTVDGADDSENGNSPSVRPVSRARTDVSLRYRSARDRTSLGREYTSSHPLPSFVRKGDDSATEGSPSTIPSSGLPTRRPYASSNAKDGSSNLPSPATPRDNIQPGYRRYVSHGVGRESSPYLSSTEHTPENVTVQRGSASGTRRSLALTSRLGQVGSFMNSRLRAAKAERERQESVQEQQKALTLHVNQQEADDDRENEAVFYDVT